MEFEFLQVERVDSIGILTLNRPDKRNALSIALREELWSALDVLSRDDGVSVLVLLSAGPVYCAGFDLSEFADRTPEHVKRFNESSVRYHEIFAEFPKPIVTGIQGPAMGGGFDLASLCDVRIASAAAKFAHPEIKFGAAVLFGPLNTLIPGGLARDLALTGRTIDADTALRLGFLSRIVDADGLREETLSTARTIAEAPLSALLSVKRQIIDSYGGREVLGRGDAFAFSDSES